jgi:hypothetical protein
MRGEALTERKEKRGKQGAISFQFSASSHMGLASMAAPWGRTSRFDSRFWLPSLEAAEFLLSEGA